MNNKQKFIAIEFDYVLDQATPENRLYKPKLQINHCGAKTKHISISWEQLEQIKQLLIETSESE